MTDTTLPWKSGEPNGGTNENCGALKARFVMFDISCESERPYVCEKENQIIDNILTKKYCLLHAVFI